MDLLTSLNIFNALICTRASLPSHLSFPPSLPPLSPLPSFPCVPAVMSGKAGKAGKGLTEGEVGVESVQQLMEDPAAVSALSQKIAQFINASQPPE